MNELSRIGQIVGVWTELSKCGGQEACARPSSLSMTAKVHVYEGVVGVRQSRHMRWTELIKCDGRTECINLCQKKKEEKQQQQRLETAMVWNTYIRPSWSRYIGFVWVN